MNTVVIKTTVNPFSGMFYRLMKAFEISGYYKAARELNRLGYYTEAKSCIALADALKAEVNPNLNDWV